MNWIGIGGAAVYLIVGVVNAFDAYDRSKKNTESLTNEEKEQNQYALKHATAYSIAYIMIAIFWFFLFLKK